MDIQFFSTKNNLTTCSANNFFFHSKYDPVKEAKRFVDSVQADFDVHAVVVTGPALSYCTDFLRQRFPDALLIAVEYCGSFLHIKQHWDYYFECQNDFETIATKILFLIGEEKISQTLFLSWQPSENIFPDEFKSLWLSLKTMIHRSMDILATNIYFNKRWLFNTYKFFLSLENIAVPQKTHLPILIVASGQTLAQSLSHIKKHENSFFIITVSSAVNVLLQNNIEPDMVIATDGGFWASYHLAPLLSIKNSIPVALSPEAFVPSKIYKKHQIVLLNYEDGLSSVFFQALQLPCLRAKRNGTVVGTAIQLAFDLTSQDIYCCGLDLSNEKGFSHCQPNMLEKNNAMLDYCLKPLSSRLFKANCSVAALDIYAAWFDCQSAEFKKRIIRIKDKGDFFRRSLSGIGEKNWQDFSPNLNLQKKTLFENIPVKKDLFHTVLQNHTIDFEKKINDIFINKVSDENLDALKKIHYQSFLYYKKEKILSAEKIAEIKKIFTKIYCILETYAKN
ncbi:MAG: 6-hydroxymethylpterin diphosphokinase MptE-like protein [Treponemataceae bacterium]